MKKVVKHVVNPEDKKLEGLWLSVDDCTYKISDLTIPNKINNLKEDSFRCTCLNCQCKKGWHWITVKKFKFLIDIKNFTRIS